MRDPDTRRGRCGPIRRFATVDEGWPALFFLQMVAVLVVAAGMGALAIALRQPHRRLYPATQSSPLSRTPMRKGTQIVDSDDPHLLDRRDEPTTCGSRVEIFRSGSLERVASHFINGVVEVSGNEAG